MKRTAALVVWMGVVMALGGCSQCGGGAETGGGGTEAGGGETTPTQGDDEAAAQPSSKVLLVAQSTFSRNEKGRWVQPNEAKLIILRQKGSTWDRQEITDDESNVFHKGVVEGGAILTIGGEKAALKRWTRSGDDWTAETLWQPTFGGEFDRLRDLEIANFNGGPEEIVLATHDQGVVAVVSHTDEGWQAAEIDREANTFVHEVEVGDVDGDGTPEIYSTPSHPNRGSGGAQPGQVKQYRRTDDGFEGSLVFEWERRHAKEILVADLDGDGRDELYAALEGETEPQEGRPLGRLVTPAQIVRLTPGDDGWTSEVVGTIPNERQCRFLLAGDLNGDGDRELIAAAFTTGIWMFQPGDSIPWEARNLTRATGGFEHASLLADIDGDGSQELYVADDTHGRLVRFTWSEGQLSDPEVLLTRTVPQSAITWNLWVAEL